MLASQQTMETQEFFYSIRKKLIFFSALAILVSWLSIISFAIKFTVPSMGLDGISASNVDSLVAVISPLFNTLQVRFRVALTI
jgi:hypothetical protein